ncbi:hypothetical protein [Pinibacter aurantiacus]|uniref:DUF3592 domain-containing protein n=1 Tax=Pinibacter aurantiacus TaxID=2851599 RepID=A0A9E2S548_9BACT|nr:hypothetical protein [Pinibacter aurantiacus]MBV4355797.1 hypothetical protein [Pinibacter aurantiacus]
MKLFLIIGGLFLIIFTGLVPLPRKIQEYKTQKEGEIVETVVIRVESCVNHKALLIFKYNDQRYDKWIDCNIDYKKGDILRLKHLEDSDIFLFEQEDVTRQFIASGFLIVFGLIFVVKGFKYKS